MIFWVASYTPHPWMVKLCAIKMVASNAESCPRETAVNLAKNLFYDMANTNAHGSIGAK